MVIAEYFGMKTENLREKLKELLLVLYHPAIKVSPDYWVIIKSILKFVGVDVCDIVITCSASCSTNYSSSQGISWLSGQRLELLALVGLFWLICC